MTPTLQQKLMRAVTLHRTEQFAEAEALYREILQDEPQHFDALHMLGALHLQTGRNEEAARLIGRAVTINGQDAVAHNNYGNALQSLQRYDDALKSYDGSLALRPDYDEALRNKGDVLRILGRPNEALAIYDKALALHPAHTEILNNRGVTLLALERAAEALEAFEKVIALQPRHGAAHGNRGDALRLLGRYDDALASYQQAIAIAPDQLEPLANYGNTLRLMLRYAEALAVYDKVLVKAPDHIKTLNNRGIVLRDTLRYSEALISFDRALALKPDYVEAMINRGTTLHELGRIDDAVAGFNAALALAPDHPDAHWNRAISYLTRGELAAGWSDYEWKRKSEHFGFPRRPFVQRVWDGGHLGKAALLVWGEQGVGDEILYGSMVGELVARGMPVLWEADARLLPLIQRSYPGLATVARTTPPDPATAAAGAHISTASLGQYLRPSTESFPKGRKSFLVADSAKAQAYRAKLLGGSKTRLIGLSWVSKNQELGIHKTTALTALAPLWQAVGPETRFVDLQYGDTATERAASGLDLAHLAELDLFNDLDGLAALISACDLVITVSNTTAHLAGALGVPVWVMVPAGNGKLWYWGETGSSWYPSAHVFRQNTPGAWDTLIADIAKKLAKP